jgi:hypothetical protein
VVVVVVGVVVRLMGIEMGLMLWRPARRRRGEYYASFAVTDEPETIGVCEQDKILKCWKVPSPKEERRTITYCIHL